jgi:hypothetical protein
MLIFTLKTEFSSGDHRSMNHEETQDHIFNVCPLLPVIAKLLSSASFTDDLLFCITMRPETSQVRRAMAAGILQVFLADRKQPSDRLLY